MCRLMAVQILLFIYAKAQTWALKKRWDLLESFWHQPSLKVVSCVLKQRDRVHCWALLLALCRQRRLHCHRVAAQIIQTQSLSVSF